MTMSRTLPTAYMDEFGRADANEAAFIQRALNQVEAETYNTVYPPLRGMQHVPVDLKFDEGAKTFEYRRFTKDGVARIVTGRGKDLPTAGLFVQSYIKKFHYLGSSYRYSLEDLKAAMLASKNGQPVNIETELASTAREAIDAGLDHVCAIGSATNANITGLANGIGPDVGMLGILNQPNASTYTLATGAGGSIAWNLKTPDEIIADLHGICISIIDSTYETFEATRILLPVQRLQLIKSVRMGDGSDESILSLFQKQRPGVTVDSWRHCAAAGTSGQTRMVAYQAEARVVRHVISMMFRQMPPEYRNREFKTDCLARTAGVVSQYPLGIAYADGL